MIYLMIWVLVMPLAIMYIARTYKEIENSIIFIFAFFWPIALHIYLCNRSWNLFCSSIEYLLDKIDKSKIFNKTCEAFNDFINSCKGTK